MTANDRNGQLATASNSRRQFWQTGSHYHTSRSVTKMKQVQSMAFTPNISRRINNCLVLSATLSIWVGIAFAADQVPSSNASAPALGSVAQAALNVGVLNCAGRIAQVSQFIGANAQVGAYFFAPSAQPDQRLSSVSYELQTQGNTAPAYASASFAPNQANGCGAVYEAVIYWPQNCDVVATRQFPQAKKLKALHKSIQPLESGLVKIFLMPAGSGCVSIKKEVIQ